MADEQDPAFRRRKGKEIAVVDDESAAILPSSSSSSSSNPEKSFSFQVSPASVLKQALDLLNDFSFNSMGLAILEVTPDGPVFSFRNDETRVAANLIFKHWELINFRCTKPLPPHMVSLDQIVVFLVDVQDHESLTVYHLHGSDHLSFFFESAPWPMNELNVELMPIKADDERFAVKECFCKVPLSSSNIKEMLGYVEAEVQPEDVQVSVEVRRECGKLCVKLVQKHWKSWVTRSPNHEVVAGQKHRALFKLPHVGLISRATSQSKTAAIGFLVKPENHITIQFFLEEFGEVEIMKAVELTSECDDGEDDSWSSGDEFGNDNEDEVRSLSE